MEKHSYRDSHDSMVNGKPHTADSDKHCYGHHEETKTRINLTFREKWRNPVFRDKCVYSFFMAAAFGVLGLHIGQHGPTFLDIQIITHTDLEKGSAFFTGGNAGFLAGNIIAGLLFNKVNTPLLMFISTFGMGIANLLIPFCVLFELMIFIRFVSATFGGALSTALNTAHMTVWGSEANGLLNLIHFCYSFGGVIAPLIAEPFLMEKSALHTTNTTANNGSTQYSNTSSNNQPTPESRVEYVFFITGACILISSIPFLVIFIKSDNKSKNPAKNRKFLQRNVPFSLLIIMLVGICLFMTFHVCVEVTFFNFLMAFVVKQFESVSKSKGAFITVIAWASFAVGRFLMIFATKIFTPVQLILILTTLMAVSIPSFSLCAYFGIVNAVIVFAALSGFAMSGLFPAGLALAEMELFPLTGIITSSITVTCSVGSTLNPLLLGYLMEQYSTMWFCYLFLMQTFIEYFILISLLVFSKFYVDKKYGSLASTSNLNMTQEIAVPNGKSDSVNINDSDAQTKFL